MKIRVMFVDDEPAVLQGLRRSLRRQRREWDMHFCESGDEALEQMGNADQHFDVVVSDMRMPKMDGYELLCQVKERHPRTLRIVLTGQTELERAVQVVPIAHRYLSKPCEPELLLDSIRGGQRLAERVRREDLLQLVTNSGSLPVLPALFQELTQLLRSEDCSLGDVAKLIAGDTAMSARIISLAGSAFFGQGKTISDINRAAQVLGMDVIRGVVLSTGLFAAEEHQESAAWLARVQSHSVIAGAAARRICEQSAAREHAFLGGLLHDVGQLLSIPRIAKSPQGLQGIDNDTDLHHREQELLGADHAEIGALLATIWGLPDAVAEAILYHTSEVDPSAGPACHAVHQVCQILDATRIDELDNNLDTATKVVIEEAERFGVKLGTEECPEQTQQKVA